MGQRCDLCFLLYLDYKTFLWHKLSGKLASWLVSSYQLWAVWPEGGSVGALPACRESAVERLASLCSEMQPGRKLNRQAQERQKGIYSVGYFHSCPGFGFKQLCSALHWKEI